MSHIAKRLQYFDSGDFRDAIRKQVKLTNPIDLSIGIPEENTSDHVKAAAIRAIKENKTIYTPAAGLIELRKALAKKLTNQNRITSSIKNVAIVPGLTTAQLLVYLTILDPGDEIIVFDPYYPPYPHLASMIGGKVVYVSTLPDFQPDLAAIQSSITERTRAIVINSPNNPTGAVYPETTLRQIAAIAADRDITIISDEIYEHFTYDIDHFSIGSVYPNTITMNGFSKEFGMTGWRLGYVVGPTDFIEALTELLQYAVMSSSSIAQYAALAALKHYPDITTKYRAKRDYLGAELERMGYHINGMQGAFYAFIKTPHGISDAEFVDKATRHNLILVPGRAFSRLPGYFRLSYGANLETLQRGVAALTEITQNI